MSGDVLNYHTQSLCPECFRPIDARHIARGEDIFLEKSCPDHGTFSVRIWQGRESYDGWVRPKIPIQQRFHMTETEKGCPFDCGLCPDHTQHTCTAVLDITRRCNLSCRFCFADAGGGAANGADPALDTLKRQMDAAFSVSPDANLQLSGGEPGVRADLPEVVSAARAAGFSFVQINTNGIALAEDPTLAPRLKEAGLTSVFLQFDGVRDRVYETLRGRPLADLKEKAVRACGQSGIGVVLVPTLVPGINDHEIGDILRYGLDHRPGVRGVHFQPVSYFGRHPAMPGDESRITIPHVLSAIQTQSKGQFRIEDFRPSSCEHALCSFTGKFICPEEGPPKALNLLGGNCCTPVPAEQGSRKARASVKRHWKAAGTAGAGPGETAGAEDGLDRFIRRAEREMFTVSGMAFQDAWTLDLERLKGCCIHAVAPDGRLIPFCAYNLTRSDGKGLYRNKGV